MAFAIGDVVYLKCGSRPMVVEATDDKGVVCVWQDGRVQYAPELLATNDPTPDLNHAKDLHADQLNITRDFARQDAVAAALDARPKPAPVETPAVPAAPVA